MLHATVQWESTGFRRVQIRSFRKHHLEKVTTVRVTPMEKVGKIMFSGWTIVRAEYIHQCDGSCHHGKGNHSKLINGASEWLFISHT